MRSSVPPHRLSGGSCQDETTTCDGGGGVVGYGVEKNDDGFMLKGHLTCDVDIVLLIEL